MRDIAAAHDCDAFLAFGSHGHAEHFRYLTNFAPALGDAWLVVAGPAPVCVLDFDWQVEEARRRSGLEDWRGRVGAGAPGPPRGRGAGPPPGACGPPRRRPAGP